MAEDLDGNQMWKELINGSVDWAKDRKRYRLFPSKKRCKNCNAPFDGIGAWFARLTGRGQFKKNPRFCDF